jgi:hypothetical protein
MISKGYKRYNGANITKGYIAYCNGARALISGAQPAGRVGEGKRAPGTHSYNIPPVTYEKIKKESHPDSHQKIKKESR